MEYNRLQSDIRLIKTSKEDAIKIIKQFEGKWIYIKLVVNLIIGHSLHDYVANYNKFKIASVNEDSYSKLLFVYGNEDEDRIIVSTDEIIQTEKSNMEDELRLILKNEKTMTDIYIKSFVPNKERLIRDLFNINQNLIITEGKSDWKHLKAAFKKFNSEGLYNDLEFKFLEYEESLADSNDKLKNRNLSGADTLNTICQYNALFPNEKLRIFVFDSDVKEINKLYKTENGYHYLGNNVYAVTLPVPEFRKEKNNSGISIENYYTDDEIKTKDKGKRLYLSSEFNFDENGETGKIYSLKASENPDLVIDDEVYKNYQNLKIPCKKELHKLIDEGKLEKVHTLSKNKFAENILNEIAPFDKISKDNFKLFFDVIKDIFKIHTQTKMSENLGFISKKEIQKDIEIECYHDHQDLHLNIGLPDEIIKELRNNAILASSIYVENNDKIIISIGTPAIKKVQWRIDISLDLLDFIFRKAESANNRVYFNVANKENHYVCSYELFTGDNGHIAFNHLLKQLPVLW